MGGYMLSPSSEFWSVEFEEFKEIVTVFGEAVRKYDVPAQVFCGWYDLPGVVDRMQFAHARGRSRSELGSAIPE